MNLNNFTIKSQEAIQQAQILVQTYGQQQIEPEHIFKAILEVDENVTPFILKKVNVNIENLTDIQNKNSGLTAAVSLIVSVKSVNRIILPPMEKGLHMPW